MEVIAVTAISLGSISFIAGLVLFIAAKKFAVVENPLIDTVEELLPAANCGGCGFAGCRSFAEELVNTKNTDLTCPVAGQETMEEIAKAIGVELPTGPKMVARVMCQGGKHSKREGNYQGIMSCSAVSVTNMVDLVCSYGCMGYGDCLKACPFGCIEIVDGIAVINEDTCTGCGLCIKACPRNLIVFTPKDKKIFVACSSPDKGVAVKKYCSVGCIGCKLCVKACEFDAIDYSPFLAVINTDKCTLCGACVEKCPVDAILDDNTILFAKIKEKQHVHV